MTDSHLALQLYSGYTDADIGIFQEFVNHEATPEPGFLTDFLGTRIRTTSVWKQARTLDGQLLEIPVPADFHAEAVEWIGLLKAVRGATGQYVAMELGAGFGSWTIAGAVAARSRGIEDIRLCAVEGDSQHFRSLRQHFLDNGFDPNRHRLIEAAVGAHAGVAEWPVLEESSAVEEWGLRPIGAKDDSSVGQFQATKKVSVIPMNDLLLEEACWDLIHIDVQGDEVEICRSCLDELSARARWIVVGTHSRKLDGDFLELMCGAGWVLEHEKPSKFSFIPNLRKLEAMTIMDGTQVWRNPRLTPALADNRLTSFSQEIASPVPTFHVRAGAIYTLDLKVKNTSPQPWPGNGRACVNLSYRWLDNLGNVLAIEGNRAPLNSSVLKPGDSTLLKLDVLAPAHPGSYRLLLSMVQEGVSWFFDQGAEPLLLQVTVQ